MISIKAEQKGPWRIRIWSCSLGLAICFPSVGAAQPAQKSNLTPEVFASIGWSHLFRIEDRSFGDRPNIGVGMGFRLWPRLGIEFELNRTLGLSPRPVPCPGPAPGAVAVACLGTGREGVRSATTASANVSYFFSDSSIQPYLTGGIGALWSKEVFTYVQRTPTQVVLTEQDLADTGLAENIGAGVLIPITRAISLRPEFRVYLSILQSQANLTFYRASIDAGYHW